MAAPGAVLLHLWCSSVYRQVQESQLAAIKEQTRLRDRANDKRDRADSKRKRVSEWADGRRERHIRRVSEERFRLMQELHRNKDRYREMFFFRRSKTVLAKRLEHLSNEFKAVSIEYQDLSDERKRLAAAD